MGWWNMGVKGGIAELTGGPKCPEKQLVTGDGPADIIDGFLSDFDGRITEEQLRAVVVRNEMPEGLDLEVLEAARKTRVELFQEYKEAWQRDPEPEELDGVIDFCWPMVV